MDKFYKDFKQGKKYEDIALGYLDYDKVEYPAYNCKEYDLITVKNNIKNKIEVKSDRQAPLTGNMAIEYECRNKPSGINATTADFWLYFVVGDKDSCYKIPVDTLKELVKNCRKVSGGDDMASKMYLLKWNTLDKYKIEKIEKKKKMLLDYFRHNCGEKSKL